MYEKSAIRRAQVVTVLFSLFGLASLLYFFGSISWPVTLPLLVFYAGMVWSAFYSIRYFATIAPANRWMHMAIDLVLVLSYAGTATALTSPMWFALTNAILFIAATGKYTLLYWDHKAPSTTLLSKARIDALGALYCLAGIFWIAYFSLLPTLYVWSALFTLANTYLLLFSRLYRIEHTSFKLYEPNTPGARILQVFEKNRRKLIRLSRRNNPRGLVTTVVICAMFFGITIGLFTHYSSPAAAEEHPYIASKIQLLKAKQQKAAQNMRQLYNDITTDTD